MWTNISILIAESQMQLQLQFSLPFLFSIAVLGGRWSSVEHRN
jgi:hypothetical protein